MSFSKVVFWHDLNGKLALKEEVEALGFSTCGIAHGLVLDCNCWCSDGIRASVFLYRSLDWSELEFILSLTSTFIFCDIAKPTSRKAMLPYILEAEI